MFLRQVSVEIGLCGHLSTVCLALRRLAELHWILGLHICVCVNRALGGATKLAARRSLKTAKRVAAADTSLMCGATPGTMTFTEGSHRLRRRQEERRARPACSIGGLIDQEATETGRALREVEEFICPLLMAQYLGLLRPWTTAGPVEDAWQLNCRDSFLPPSGGAKAEQKGRLVYSVVQKGALPSATLWASSVLSI